MAKGSNKHSLYAGLTNKSPSVPDSSMGCKGPSVNKDATRSSTGKGGNAAGPGPREA